MIIIISYVFKKEAIGMSVFWTSIQSILVLIILMAIGYYMQGINWFDDKFAKALSNIILKVALPCAIFSDMISKFKIDDMITLAPGIVYVILSIFIGYFISWLVVKALHVSKERRIVMMAGFNITNTAFIGLPLNVALFGAISLPYLIVYYLVNTVILWTFTLWTFSIGDPTLSTQAVDKGERHMKLNWQHIIPAPLWGFIVAIPFMIWWPDADHALSTFILQTLHGLGALVTPLALFYIGIMLRKFGLRNMSFGRDNIIVLIGRFIVAPALMVGIIWVGSGFGIDLVRLFSHTLVIQAVTPAFAVLPILADQYHCDVKFATDIVVSTSTLFVIVVPIIMWLLTVY